MFTNTENNSANDSVNTRPRLKAYFRFISWVSQNQQKIAFARSKQKRKGVCAVFAFRDTLDRFIYSYEQFIKEFDELYQKILPEIKRIFSIKKYNKPKYMFAAAG